MRLLFVGQNPSPRNKDARVAFAGTKSGDRLNNWLFALTHDFVVDKIEMVNVTNDVKRTTPTKEELDKLHALALKYTKVVALGNEAEKALLQCTKKQFFKLPHPSGRNRKLNDQDWVFGQLRACREYLRN